MSAYFSGVFGKSPFSGVQRHIELCVQAGEQLPALFDAASNGDWTLVEQLYAAIAQIENEADLLKREIRSQLPHGFFLPVSRVDLLDLLGRQDEIANRARDIAGVTTGRHMQFPTELADDVSTYLTVSLAACQRVRGVVKEIDELIEAGFRGAEAEAVLDMIEQVEIKEGEADELQIIVRGKLFSIEKDLPPVDVMFTYQIIDLIGELANDAERIAHRVQLMLAR